MDFKCNICGLELNEINLMVRHLKVIHMVKENVSGIRCVVNKNSCKKSYASFKALKEHTVSCIKKEDHQDSFSLKQFREENVHKNPVSSFETKPIVIPRTFLENVSLDTEELEVRFEKKDDHDQYDLDGFTKEFINEQ